MSTILQIVPQAPGTRDGVGDYALQLAKTLRETFARQTAFLPAQPALVSAVDGFEILAPLGTRSAVESLAKKFDHIVLHYVNYGYQKRGIPFALLPILRRLRRNCSGRFLTIFHELYASGRPWQSAFWLRPFQIQIARAISRMSDACVVSNEAMLKQLQSLVPGVNASVHPVISNFGEPSLAPSQLADRDPHRWVICGGTALVERSVRSFHDVRNRIPDFFSPRALVVFGGNENPVVRSSLSKFSGVQTDYHPQIEVAHASRILSTCSFFWLDYFDRPDVPTDAILKSGAFAAACAHGVICVFPHHGSAISVAADRLPGPYFLEPDGIELPDDRANIASDIYAWYRRCASSQHLARGIAGALGLVHDMGSVPLS